MADDRDRPSWEPKDLTEAIAEAVRKQEAAKVETDG